MALKTSILIFILSVIPSQGITKTAHIITTAGDISFTFFTKQAPKTSNKIFSLFKSNFYKGISFHRVIKGFVAQAGDPTGTGMGGSGKKILFENNNLKHQYGMVGLARSGDDLNSGDSQFYICLNTLPHLDGQYVIFAKVTKGIEVLQRIVKGTKILSTSVEESK